MIKQFFLSHRREPNRVGLGVMVMKGAPHYPNYKTGASPSDAVSCHTQDTQSLDFLNATDPRSSPLSTFKIKRVGCLFAIRAI